MTRHTAYSHLEVGGPGHRHLLQPRKKKKCRVYAKPCIYNVRICCSIFSFHAVIFFGCDAARGGCDTAILRDVKGPLSTVLHNMLETRNLLREKRRRARGHLATASQQPARGLCAPRALPGRRDAAGIMLVELEMPILPPSSDSLSRSRLPARCGAPRYADKSGHGKCARRAIRPTKE